MAHALVVNVTLPSEDSPGQRIKMLNDAVIPHAKSQAGFQSGTWIHEHGNGLAMMIFDTEAHALAAQKGLNPPPDGPKLISSTLYEVGGQA